MTIMNLHLERDLAIVASNTDMLMMNGADHVAGTPACKVFALPDKSAVLLGRGVMGLIFNAFAWSHSSPRDFDGLGDDLEQGVAAIASHTLNEIRAAGALPPVTDRDLLGELMLVGWSRSRDSMACHHVTVSNAGAVRVTEIYGAVVPWVWGEHPATQGDLESMTALARRQSALAEKDCPGKAWRGDLTLARITRESINLSTVREFWREPRRVESAEQRKEPEAVS